MSALAALTATNTSFSRRTPGLQLAVDSTSLGAFKRCPRYYYYTIICGWQSRLDNAHLTFGILMHSAREHYYHARARGASHDDALATTVAWALTETFDRRLGRPWASDHPVKNRMSLIRTIIWYFDARADDSAFHTIILANGKPAVELSFTFDSGFASDADEQIVLCGHLDRLVDDNAGITYIDDLKTTAYGLDNRFFAKFTPHNQFSLYVAVAPKAWHKRVQGIMVEGAQIGATFSRFERQFIPRSEPFLAEWFSDVGRQLRWMGECAAVGEAADHAESGWPMNDESCDKYGGCPFRAVCARPPRARDAVLAVEFVRRIWDPLQRRGDI